MSKIRATLKFYRRSATSPTHIISEGPDQRGGIYREFEETWERPSGDEQAKHKRRVSQKATGRAFKFIDRVSPEYLQDNPRERCFTDRCLVLTLPEDCTYLRLMRV